MLLYYYNDRIIGNNIMYKIKQYKEMFNKSIYTSDSNDQSDVLQYTIIIRFKKYCQKAQLLLILLNKQQKIITRKK